MLKWFKGLTLHEKYLVVSLVFLIIMLMINWNWVTDGFIEGLEKFGIIQKK